MQHPSDTRHPAPGTAHQRLGKTEDAEYALALGGDRWSRTGPIR